MKPGGRKSAVHGRSANVELKLNSAPALLILPVPLIPPTRLIPPSSSTILIPLTLHNLR